MTGRSGFWLVSWLQGIGAGNQNSGDCDLLNVGADDWSDWDSLTLPPPPGAALDALTRRTWPLGVGRFRWSSSRSLGYRPGPPRIFPLVHIPPSQPGTRAGRPVAVSSECHGPDRLRHLLSLLGEEVHPVRCVLWWKWSRVSGVRHGKWDGFCTLMGVVAGTWLRWPASVLERDLCSGESAFCRAAGGGSPGSTARPNRLAGMNGVLTGGRLRRIYASALPTGDGCALNTIPSWNQ